MCCNSKFFHSDPTDNCATTIQVAQAHDFAGRKCCMCVEFAVFKTSLCCFAKGSRTHTRQPQPHARQQQIDKIFVEFILCASSKPRHKALLSCGAAAGDTCGKDRTGPISCGVQSVAANHSSDNNLRGLLTKWRTARSSPNKKWRDDLTRIKGEKSCRLSTSMHGSM